MERQEKGKEGVQELTGDGCVGCAERLLKWVSPSHEPKADKAGKLKRKREKQGDGVPTKGIKKIS